LVGARELPLFEGTGRKVVDRLRRHPRRAPMWRNAKSAEPFRKHAKSAEVVVAKLLLKRGRHPRSFDRTGSAGSRDIRTHPRLEQRIRYHWLRLLCAWDGRTADKAEANRVVRQRAEFQKGNSPGVRPVERWIAPCVDPFFKAPRGCAEDSRLNRGGSDAG
jgi:hypothetical protein